MGTGDNSSPEPEFQISRIFVAPHKLAWRAWTGPGHLAPGV